MPHFPSEATSHISYPVGPDSRGVTLTAGSANVKGSYAQIAAAIAFASNSLEFFIGATTTTTCDILIDLASGAGGAETVVIPNILSEGTPTTSIRASGSYFYRLALASGVRIAARCQASTGAITVSDVSVTLTSAGTTAGVSSYTAYGVSTSTSAGTTIDPGGTINVKGSYAELTPSTSGLIQTLTYAVSYRSNGSIPDGIRWAVDLAKGAGGAETSVVPDLRHSVGFGRLHLYPRSNEILTYIATSTRLAARASNSHNDATDRLFDLGLVGAAGSGTHYPQSATGLGAVTYPVGPTAAGLVTSASGSANVKGAYSAFVASTTFEANHAILHAVTTHAASRQILIDLARGAAGAEVVTVANLLAEGASTASKHTGGQYVIPIAILTGSRVATRFQVNSTTSDLELTLTLIAAGSTVGPDAWTTYGADTSDSGGTQIDPGGTVDVKGSYSQITAATTNIHKAVILCATIRGNTSSNNLYWGMDLATGAAAAETVLIPDLRFSCSSTTQLLSPRSYSILAFIDLSTRLAIRASCTNNDATDRLIDMSVVGLGPETIALAEARCQEGGEIVVVADPTDGEIFTGRVISPRAWLQLGFGGTSTPNTEHRLALDRYNHPPSYHGGLKLPLLVNIGAITRRLGSRISPYLMADCALDVDDSSRLLSTLEATAATEHWHNREAYLFLASRETIAAAGTAHALFRGLWREHRSHGLQRTIGLSDILGSEFSDFNLEKTVPSELVRTPYPDADPSVLDKVVPIAYGNWTDETEEVSGDAVANVTAVEVTSHRPAPPSGFSFTAVSGGQGTNGMTWYAKLAAISGGVETLFAEGSVTLTATNRKGSFSWSSYGGGTGFRLYLSTQPDFTQYRYAEFGSGVTSATSELHPSTIESPWVYYLRAYVHYWVYAILGATFSSPGISPTVLIAPITKSFGRRVQVGWSAYTGATGYRLIRHRMYYNRWQAFFDFTVDLASDVLSYTDDIDGVHVPIDAALDQPEGTLPLIYVGTNDVKIPGTTLQELLLCKGAIRHIESVWRGLEIEGSDEFQWERVPDSAFGVSWWAPGKPGWDTIAAVNYIERNDGQWYTALYTTEDPLPPGGIRVNACTRTDISDGTGSVITSAPRAIYHLLTNEVLPQRPWLAGEWLDPATFNDGTPILNSGSFAVLEALQVLRLGNAEGYQCHLFLDREYSLRELLGLIWDSFGIAFGQSHHGQVIAKELNEYTDLSTCRVIADATEIIETQIDRALSEMQNKIVYDWKYRPAGAEFQQAGLELEDEEGIDANRGRLVKGDRRQFLFTRDSATVQAVLARSILYSKFPPRVVTLVGTLHWLSVKLGDVVLVTDCEGIGATGWVQRPCWVIGIQVTVANLEQAPTVRLTVVDVYRILSGAGVMGNSSTLGLYTAETTANQQKYFFLASTVTNQFSDGSPAKRLR